VRINVGGKETILATLTAGEFFGDISLFDPWARSADVLANADSLLVRFPRKTLPGWPGSSRDRHSFLLGRPGKTLIFPAFAPTTSVTVIR